MKYSEGNRYSEGLDLVQNIKQLQSDFERIDSEISQVEPSVTEILELKDRFENLRNDTLDAFRDYEGKMKDQQKTMDDLIESGKSQLKQVTDDVESLVNLGANFTQMRDTLERVIEIGNEIDQLGTLVWVDKNKPIPVEKRKPGKYYLCVTDTLRYTLTNDGETIAIPNRLRIGPNIGVSFDEP